MTRKVDRVVVDTGVFVNFFTGGGEDEPERLEHSTWVFEAAEQGAHELLVPAIVIAEIAGSPPVRGSHISPEIRRARVTRVQAWIYNSDFLTIELTYDIARRAADLAVEHQLKGPDATIIASAMAFDCSRVYSWDDDLLKLDSSIGSLRVVKPAAEPVQTTLDLLDPRPPSER